VKGIYADQVFNTLNNILITLSWKHDLVFFFWVNGSVYSYIPNWSDFIFKYMLSF
jgi:hypothetical protein